MWHANHIKFHPPKYLDMHMRMQGNFTPDKGDINAYLQKVLCEKNYPIEIVELVFTSS